MTDRFLKFLQVELNELLGKYDDKKPSSEKGEGFFDQIYDFFTGEETQKEEKTQENFNKERARQEYRRHRQSQNRSYNTSQNTSAHSEKKYYDALEIKEGASFEEIKTAYKVAMKKYHPDRFAYDTQKQQYAIQLSQKINEAYEFFKKKFGKQ
ncbi:MAG: DnaJ domain-containing protein [Microscillaceae bacterium]|nr:DnaJ domain-containing protein [Microscillaceae bacterium]